MFPRVLLELGLEAGEQGKRIGGRAREARQDLVVVEAPDLPGALLDDDVTERDLTVAGEDRPVPVTNGKNRGAVEHGWQGVLGWTRGPKPRVVDLSQSIGWPKKVSRNGKPDLSG